MHNLKTILKKIWKTIQNIIFPIECISCKKADTLICYHCLSTVHTRFNNSKLESGLEVYAAYGFAIPLIRKLITRAKYYCTPIIFEELTLHAISTLAPIFSLHKKQNIILIPVPLHFMRLQKRGFNQSQIIAETLSNTFLNTEVLQLVKRIKNTPQQAKLNKANRIKNIEKSFQIETKLFTETLLQNLSEYKFMIVDDVISTGSTVLEVEKLLIKEFKIPKKNIMAISLCRGG